MHLPKRKVRELRENRNPVARSISAWKLGGLSAVELARRVFQAMAADELFTRAAALSYYFMFALFPTLLSLLAVVGLLAQVTDVRANLGKRLGELMPPSALNLIENTLRGISLHSSGWKLGLGLLAALWSGSGGMSCIMDALDRSYRVRESRTFWKRQLISIGLTAQVSVLSFLSLIIVLAGEALADFVGERTGLSRTTIALWNIAQWPIALSFILYALALIYCFGPAVPRHWRWVTPGSVVGVSVWVIASLLFRMYLRFFSTYGRSYGSLGAVMVLLLWLYLTGLAILLGGAIDAEIERAQHARA